jgi:hypothetical protein
MGLGAIKICSGIQKLMGGWREAHTDTQRRKCSRKPKMFQNKVNRLMMRYFFEMLLNTITKEMQQI